MVLGFGHYYNGPQSNYFDGKRFHNLSTSAHSTPSVWKWMLTRKVGNWPEKTKNLLHILPPARVEGGDIRVTFIGHVTLLIQTEGLNILTDPVWYDYASPIQGMGPCRIHPPALDIEELPAIDIVLLSHNHYDHMDLKTLKTLFHRDKPKMFMPFGNDTILQNYDSSIITTAMGWGEAVDVSPYFSVHLEPLHHWSARTVFDRNKALWGAFILKTPHGAIYFAGDTGFGDGKPFSDVKDKFGPMRFACLPMGAYVPQWFMKEMHMNPEEALKAFQLLEARWGMGIHFKTFRALADDGYGEPLDDLEKAYASIGVSKDHFRALDIGAVWEVGQ